MTRLKPTDTAAALGGVTRLKPTDTAAARRFEA
jgi:hypothetical protein